MVAGKAGMGTKIVGGLILGLVLITVLFQVFADIIPEAQAAGNALNDTNRCEAVGCTFDASEAIQCRDATNTSNVCAESSQTIPLSGLFVGTGVVFILVMASLLIFVLLALLRPGKK